MKKNETYIAECLGYNIDGYGVVRIDDFVVFVPNLMKHEKAEIALTRVNKTYGYGRVVNILEPSENRVEAVCAVHKQCGGCQLQHMNDIEQQSFKEDIVRDCFRQNAKMDIDLEPLVSTKEKYHYRNKAQVPVQLKDGKTLMGFYRNRTNEIIPYDTCAVQSDLSNAIVNFCKKEFEKLSCTKQIRHVLIKHAHVRDEAMVCLVVNTYPINNQEKLIQDLLKEFSNIKSIVAILNKRSDNVILDGKEYVLYGNSYIEEELMGKVFEIHAKSFFQINPYTTPLLYQKAIDNAALTGNEVVVDLYCGTGTIGILCANHAKKVYGIEIVSDAIVDAKRNAEKNNIENIEFLNMDAQKGAQALLRSKIKVDVVIVDPPRKGCSPETINAIKKINPKRIVYVSCNPATLARDVQLLQDEYSLENIQPFDMFPQTTHVEAIVLLYRAEC